MSDWCMVCERLEMNPNSHPRFTNTIFTSLSQFVNSSALFPTHDRRIGLIVTCGYHPQHRRALCLIEEEQPSFISTSLGEYVEPDNAESTLRQKCSSLAAMCRQQAKELTEHAKRLEALASQPQPLIDASKIDTTKDHEERYFFQNEEDEEKGGANGNGRRLRAGARMLQPSAKSSAKSAVLLDLEDI